MTKQRPFVFVEVSVIVEDDIAKFRKPIRTLHASQLLSDAIPVRPMCCLVSWHFLFLPVRKR
jgi:hypothetical protein